MEFRLRGSRGFSLIEMMVIIALMGIALATLVPTLRRSLGRANFDRAATELQSDLRLAVSEAKARGRTIRLDFDADTYTLMDALDSTVVRSRDFQGTVAFVSSGDPLIFPWGLVQPAAVTMNGSHASRSFQILPTGKVEEN